MAAIVHRARIRPSIRVPLIAHVIHRLDIGGMENGLVNLINRIPPDRFRHAVVCLTGYSNFRSRIQRTNVSFHTLHKPPGNSPVTHLKLWRLMRGLRPDIVHTRNLSALEAVVPAALAGVPLRVHSEHGRDIEDLDGTNFKCLLWRRLLKPFVHQYIALSKDLERYLATRVAVPAHKLTQLYNGVDTEFFRPACGIREPLPRAGFAGPDDVVIGTVGRMQPVKDPLTLARAFATLARQAHSAGRGLRLVMVGDGPLHAAVEAVFEDAGVRAHVWLPGARNDVAQLLRGMDLFVLPSVNEGICNAVLEAMASGLPVVATAVGGNPELIDDGLTGRLVPPSDSDGMAAAIADYCGDPAKRQAHGRAARAAVERRFGMAAMVSRYVETYQGLLAGRPSLPGEHAVGGRP